MRKIVLYLLITASFHANSESFQFGKITWEFNVPPEYSDFIEKKSVSHSSKYYKSEELVALFKSNSDYLRVKKSNYPVSMESTFESGWLAGESVVEGQFKRSPAVLGVESSAKTKMKNGYKSREHMVELKLDGDVSMFYGSFQVLLNGWLLEYQVVSPNKNIFNAAVIAWEKSVVE